MKFTINKILLVLLALAGTIIIGCKKFVEVESLSQNSIADAFLNVANATSSLLGVYDELSGDNGYGIRLSMYFPYDADDMFTSGNSDNGRRGIGRYNLNSGNTELNAPFRQLYRGVEKANMCIEQIPLMDAYNNGSDADKKEARRLYGEALTLRAQFFFELIRNWGDVPAPFSPSYVKTNLFLPKSSRDSTYDRILDDLKTAEDLVPWRLEAGSRNERITKGAVKAVRAKIALFRGGYSLRPTGGNAPGKMERRDDYLKYYQIARDECFELMQNRSQHTLNPSFENIFRTLCAHQFDPAGEIIFEVAHAGGSATSDSKLGYYDGPSISGTSRYGQSGTGIRALFTYFYAFDSVDTRRDVTITNYSIDANNIKSAVKLNAITDGKFRRDWSLPLVPGTINYVGFNWPIIRFSDVLLMFAEAENELNGPTAAAISAYEEVRKRAYAGNESRIGTTPKDKAGFFNAIVKERLLEFGDEGVRKYDLIRWNMLKTKLDEARQNMTDLMNGAGIYAGLPKVIYYKNNGEEIQWLTSFYKTEPATAPAGSKSIDWVKSIVATNISDPTMGSAFAQFFTPGKSELLPYDQSTLSAYNGALTNDYGY